MKTSSQPYAFVLGESVNALGVVKALGRCGIPTILMHSIMDTIARFSRYASAQLVPNPAEDPEAYIDTLIRAQKKLKVPVVLFPTTDISTMTISKFRGQLEANFRFVIPSDELIQQVTSKDGFYNLARKHQLPVPKTYTVCNEEEVRNVAGEVVFPCLIKPHYSHSWRTPIFRQEFGRIQIIKVHTAEELLEQYKKVAAYDNRIVVQEFIQGSDDCEYSLHTYSSRNGKTMVNFLAHKLRLDPIHHGSGAFIQTAHVPEIFQIGNEFLRKINYRGMSSFQFKWDPVRKGYFAIELNPRYSLWNFLEPSCGVNYPLINYLDSLGQPFDVPQDYPDGIKWFSMERDINAFLSYRAEGSLTFSQWIGSYAGKKYCAEFSFDDPLPFLVFVSKMASRFVKKYIRKVFR